MTTKSIELSDREVHLLLVSLEAYEDGHLDGCVDGIIDVQDRDLIQKQVDDALAYGVLKGRLLELRK